jgi:pimeloyl-ACP methyl ester carboxylesterase
LVPSKPYFTVAHDRQYGWTIDGGETHGIARPVGAETTRLAIFDADATSFADTKLAIGNAHVLKSLPGRSVIALSMTNSSAPDTSLTYKAIITAQPLAPVEFAIEGDEPALTRIRDAVAAAGVNRTPSLLVRESADSPQLKVIAGLDFFRIMRMTDQRPLVLDIPAAGVDSARLVIERLEHIARWQQIAALANPNSAIPGNAIRLDIFELNERDEPIKVEVAGTGTGPRFEYVFRDGAWHAPRFKVRLTNTHSQRLYCFLLDLTQTYSVWPGVLAGAGQWLDPGQEVWALNGDPIYAHIPDKLWEQGLLEIEDTLKLCVSTEHVDATLLEQPELDVKVVTRSAASRGEPRNSFERLMSRVQTRHFQATAPSSGKLSDWMASEVTITTVRPRSQVTLPPAGSSVDLASGVSVLGHPTLKASVRLSNPAVAARDADSPMLPPSLLGDPAFSRPFEFFGSRSADTGLSVLELSDLNDPSLVTPEHPLRLRVETTLSDSEHILPIGYDGEFFLPLGHARTEQGSIVINLERLPAAGNTRSLTSAVRILFQKLVAPRLGFAYKYPLLAAVEASGRRITDLGELRARVAGASRIVLYVHGIIGDTLGMAASAYTPLPEVVPPVPLLSQQYDLVLAFDYENLNTPIEQSARDLKQRLASVGLDSGHDKILHVVAHSMGGLVSRWLIEREGGDRIIQRLVMLGTPNGGSPWPVVQNWASTAISLALNGLTPMAWPAKVVGGLVAVIERLDVALDQMEPGSAFLKSLDASECPKIPYVILAGNTTLIAAAASDIARDRLHRLLAALSKQRILHEATSLAFFGAPNDIAVSVKSISAVPEAWTTRVPIQQVPSDHISYFTTPAALSALADALTRVDRADVRLGRSEG